MKYVARNELLAIKICQDLRPRFNIKVPKSFVHLIKRCLDANPSNRPTDNYYERYGNIIESLQTDILSEN
ncbi:hypothetical protein RclHR1_06130004 [Rhizophagus clarus]|uniref:Serine-threonine/tyrosine-protein kinase catalytic domain-containing protein n=1 Tax=Rhizophagus clarus TaxID=94130 RepID=A0A2Z6RWL3_9GLOM|nr:hypothetical protein RclHR1_06130004 [Rhizophagus clarus]